MSVFAFGKIYLSAFYAQNIADRQVTVFVGEGFADSTYWYGPQPNTTPTGLNNPNPDGDLWYDT